MDDIFSALTVVQLRKVLKSRGLSESYKVKPELVFRLVQSVQEGETVASILEILGEDEDENMATNFTFRDVEDALEKFTGESETSVEVWLNDYEEVAKNCNWNDNQKFLFARKLLDGSAKSAVRGDRQVTTYALLKAKLNKEFPEELSTVEIHERLTKRKKLSSETYLEYYYEMLAMAKDKMDDKSMILYITNGINDDPNSKAIL